jgi:hypothetical protein
MIDPMVRVDSFCGNMCRECRDYGGSISSWMSRKMVHFARRGDPCVQMNASKAGAMRTDICFKIVSDFTT